MKHAGSASRETRPRPDRSTIGHDSGLQSKSHGIYVFHPRVQTRSLQSVSRVEGDRSLHLVSIIPGSLDSFPAQPCTHLQTPQGGYIYRLAVQPAALVIHRPTRRDSQAFVTPLHRHERRDTRLTCETTTDVQANHSTTSH
jgi:hypothetical protein